MSINSGAIRKAGPFSGNGSQTSFPFTFKVFQASDLYVVLTDSSGVETVQTLTSQYTVSLNSNQDTNPGGSVVMLTAPASGYTLTLSSQVPQTQNLVLTNTGGFYPTVLNDEFDKLTILIQQVSEQVGRAAKLPISSTADANTLSNNIALLASISTEIATCAANMAAIIAAPSNATAAAASASSASTSASTATSAASTATTAASSASTSASSAASSLDTFKKNYQGAKTSDPTTRYDGSALQAGDLYFNSITGKTRVYSGTAWQDAGVSFNPQFQQFSGDGTTTSFTLATAPGTAQGLIISIGGVVQKPGYDFGVSNTTLTFTAAPPSGTNNIAVQNFGVAGTITPNAYPDPTGHTGQFLQTPDGVNVAWASVAGMSNGRVFYAANVK